MHKRFKTLLLVAVFGLLFASVGWIAPAMYAQYAPQDHYIEEHSFTAADVSATDQTHTLCFNRTIHRQSVGEVYTELYLIGDDGTRIEIKSDVNERVFQEDTRVVEMEIDLPDEIREGTYRYERIYVMEVAHGRVTRQFAFTSDRFNVTTDETTQQAHC